MAAYSRKHPYSITLQNVWDVGALNWVPMTQPGGGAGGGLTDVQLRATPVPVLATIDTTGLATSALQTTGNASLAAIKTDVDRLPALGQALAAASTPVVLTAIQVAALTPPAALVGFALEAGHLAAIDSAVARIPAQGQALAALSTPVVLTAAQMTTLTPVAALTDTQLRATPVPVSGTVTANVGSGTQPVSGTFWQATQPVSGTFWQATQPVSIATMPSTPVTGTFWQATQPVSIASMPSTPVTGTFWQATQPVSGTVTVTPPTLTKGTQGSTGFSVQNLKDAGRVNIMWTAEFSPVATAEALLTVTESRDGAATTTFTTKVVTSGKRIRITSIDLIVENTLGANPKRNKLRMKFNTAGAVTTASPLQGTWLASVATAVNTVGVPAFADFPDGIEYLGDGTKQIGFTLESPDWVTAAQTSKVYITVFAFEY